MKSLSERFRTLDNRWLYLMLAVVVSIPIFVHAHPPIPASTETIGVYRAIEAIPAGKLVMVHSTWDAASVGECEGQCHAIVMHLMKRGIPFVVWTSNPASPPFYNRIIAAEAKRYGRVYGRDWADFGFKVPGDQLKFGVQAMAQNFPAFMKSDASGTPVAKLPILNDVTDASRFGLLVSIGYNPTQEFIQFVQAAYGTKVAFAMGALHATTEISHLDSGQIVGMLVGAKGGAEYEMLMDSPGSGVKVITAQSYAHVFIIVLIIAGNIAIRRTKPESAQ